MNHPSQQRFAQRLRALRTAKGLSQRQVASGGLSVSYVSLLESGRRNPTRETVQLLATSLGCSPAELLEEEDSPAVKPPGLSVRYGQLALEVGRFDEAEQHFQAARDARDLDPIMRADVAIGLARVLEGQGRLPEAAEAYEALVREAADSPRLASLSTVSCWCRCLYELGELGRVVEVGTRAIRELDRMEAWRSGTTVRLLATVAAAHFELGEIAQAERLLREGLALAGKMHSPAARAAVLRDTSHAASEEGRHREALELAEEALVYYRHSGDSRAVARLFSQYGYLLLRQDPPRVAEATATLEEGLSILDDVGHGHERSHILTELSRANLLRGEAATAVELANRSLTELGPEAVLERARAETALAASLAVRGERAKAVELFDQAARTLRRLPASRQAARAWVELGNLLDQAGDAAAAVRAFRHAAASVNLATLPEPAGPPSRPPGSEGA